jgi:hypothetical protein
MPNMPQALQAACRSQVQGRPAASCTNIITTTCSGGNNISIIRRA